MNPGVRNTIIGVLLMIFIFTSGFVWKINQPRALRVSDMQANGLMVFEQPREVLPFTLNSHLGEPFTRDSLLGKWTMVFPGFTNCPDICPITLATLADMWDFLDAKPKSNLQVVMLSVDPKRDTPEKLGQYVPYFNDEFIGVTGDLRTTANLASQLSIAFTIVDPTEELETYNVDHTGNIVLINPEGHYHGFFRPPFDPAKLKLTYQSAWIQY